MDVEIPPEYKKLLSLVTNICREVYCTLGKGHRENIYQNAICIDLEENEIEHRPEVVIPIKYRGVRIGFIRSDIICDGEYPLIIETKVIAKLGLKERLQTGRYMQYNEVWGGILVNFPITDEEPEIEYLLIIDDKLMIYEMEGDKVRSVDG
jgi:GxxExxY protein